MKAYLTCLSGVAVFSLGCLSCYAATTETGVSLPDFYAETPVERVRSEVVQEWSRFTFLESVVSDSRGNTWISDHLEGRLYQLQDDQVSTLLDLEGALLCLSEIKGDDEHLMATAWSKRSDKTEGVLLRISKEGGYTQVASFPEEPFLNGIAQLLDGRFLMAGSATGNIWFYDPETGESGRWYHGDLTTGQYGMPGINGIKVLGDRVYFTNTSQFLVGQINVNADGSAGEAMLVTSDVLLDDFAIAPDATIYGATHRDEIVKIRPDGEKTIIAQYDQGVTGSTSVAWDQNDPSGNTLLVVTNGGINHQLFGRGESTVTPAKLVRLFLENH